MSTSQELSSPTFGNEDGLPRVPLPTLEDSCERFLEWCAPLLTSGELAVTRASVESFLAPDSPARRLHAALQAYDGADGVHSWLDTFWPYRYLGRRDRIALNANFFFLFEDANLRQVDRAAALVAGALNYKRQIDEQRLPPAVQRGQALSMEQNKYLFSATRIPGTQRDTARTPYSEDWPGPSTERHIAVFVRGNLFRLDVIGPEGAPHTLDELADGLRAVLAAGATPAAAGTSVGHLTTKARTEWAASRQALLDCHPGNADVLDTVETALFCLCLEDAAPVDPLAAADRLLHGDDGNRWFDKAVSLIVFPDGTAGINGEHCNLDGTVIVSFIDAILSSSPQDQSRDSGARAQATPSFAPLTFVVDDALRADVTRAAADFAAYAGATATTTVSIMGFTSERAKQLGCSPDAFAQLAFQLAHRRAKGHVGATYESIATRHFHHGRSEAMRVVTPEIVRFVETMADAAADDGTRRAAFRAAADKHVARAKDCQAGRAPEQHLWELALIQQRRGVELGATEPMSLYSSPGWLTMRDDYLSTSAVPSNHVQYFGFGSTSSRCIGIGYALLPDRFDLYLSAPAAVRDQMITFAERLTEAVAELDDLLATGSAGAWMTAQDDQALTAERKADFSAIYASPDPRTYFRTLAPLDYQVPQRALPVIDAVLAATARDGRSRTVLDLCCSYGINAALLRCRITLAEMSSRAADPARTALSPEQVTRADRSYFAARLRRPDLAVLGLDVSAPAIGYAVETGLLNTGWVENLEETDPTSALAAGLRPVGLIVCTGGVGYIGRRTFDRLVRAVGEPDDLWVVTFVLRVFDYTRIAEVLGAHGLITQRLPHLTFRQRRFADEAEQSAAIHDVEKRGLDPTGKEEAGWYHADCYISRPATVSARRTGDQLLARF